MKLEKLIEFKYELMQEVLAVTKKTAKDHGLIGSKELPAITMAVLAELVFIGLQVGIDEKVIDDETVKTVVQKFKSLEQKS